MRNNTAGMRIAAGFALLAAASAPRQAMAQNANATYSKMAPLDAYLMPDRAAEIALARSAAPASISADATILTLGRKGYETAVKGKNGFVCMVGRGWGAAFEWPEFWNPKIKAAACLNPQAARSILPIDELRARMALAGRSKAAMQAALAAAFANGQLPPLETGAMAYMMSKFAYLTDMGTHNAPHVMFYTHIKDAADWGSGAAGSPIMSSPYWFFFAQGQAVKQGLPPMQVFLVATPFASDGTPANQPHS